jgi:glutathione S-transferase
MTTGKGIRLYDYELSGNCYKVRLLLHWLGLTCTRIPVDFHPGRAHRSAEFLHHVNPRGQLPVLEDGDLRLPDAQAILVYLASRYDPQRRWYPDDAATRGRITLWLATADEITRTVATARLHLAFGCTGRPGACQRAGAPCCDCSTTSWPRTITTDRPGWQHPIPTVADIACFPYAALAGEAGIDLIEFPALQAWIQRAAAPTRLSDHARHPGPRAVGAPPRRHDP